MRKIVNNYIDGAFAAVTGTEEAPLFNPATEEQIGTVRLSGEDDVNAAVAAAKRAFSYISQASVEQRAAMLRNLSAAVAARGDKLAEAMREEYGAPAPFVDYCSQRAG